MKGFFLIVDKCKNTICVPADESYVVDSLDYAIKKYGLNIKRHKTFKELDKTIHDYVKGA